ncbi:hypothetical protein BTM25_50480 [Actinomadura rubteroloni]|uniref:Uncharacterized protein n=1 Tax=Actinomadura rubteroloni TaxID=1926885 RepID=A0A2P4UCR7_9ACTN|nr:hypothetical protein [Actinomadura rubteroloni]POM22843.1 hypothetical protein BTM25_50480 [Actinomadura rubteroloni]
MIVLLLAGALVPLLLIGWLVDFARASRNDSLFQPASSAHARRARRLTGMYVRGGGAARDDERLVRR